MTRIIPSLLLLLLLLGAAPADAGRFTNVPVRAVITVADKESAVTLAGRTEADLFYSPPNVPEGVYASIPLAGIQQVRLEFTMPEEGVNRALAARRWRDAAYLMLKALEPTLPYVDLPGNDAAEALATACSHLMRAGDAVRRLATPESKQQAESLYARVVYYSDRLQRAAWFYGAESARLRAAQALIALGRLDAADQRLEDAAIPEPGDGDFGLYWLTRASLAKVRGEEREALDGAARSLAFDNKNPDTFGPALIFYAQCCETIQDWHRARDVYFEIARLFRGTDLGDLAQERLAFIMKEGLTSEKEAANLAKLFFGSEEDMDALARNWLDQLAKESNLPPDGGAKKEERKP